MKFKTLGRGRIKGSRSLKTKKPAPNPLKACEGLVEALAVMSLRAFRSRGWLPKIRVSNN